MIEDLSAHYAIKHAWERYRFLQDHPEKAEPGEIERLRKELGFD